MSGSVLLIDDDSDLLALLELELRRAGFDCVCAENGSEAQALAAEERPRAAVLDLHLPDTHGRDLLAQLRQDYPELGVVVLTSDEAIEEVVECMRLGAVDYVCKPFDSTRLVTSVRNACRQGELAARVASLTSELRSREGFDTLMGDSPAMHSSLDLLQRAARSDVAVLLLGESGTGKGVAARAVHAESARRSGPFVSVNLGAVPEALLEAALFGHEKGAFTGATQTRAGFFEAAEGGTIFLDEVGELRLDLQVRLLHVLQDHAVQRVGSTKTRKLDVRVIAATNRDLEAMVAAGEYRQDLYYRLAVFPVAMPPLREREGDLLLLAHHYMNRFAEHHERAITRFTDEARRALLAYPWPGNVRELENVIERALILEDGPAISLGSLPDALLTVIEEPRDCAAGAPAPRESGPEGIRLFEVREREILLDALQRCAWSAPKAAERLGIGRATIYRKMERYELRKEAP